MAEILGVKTGLGWYLQWAQDWTAYANMYAALQAAWPEGPCMAIEYGTGGPPEPRRPRRDRRAAVWLSTRF